MKDKMKYLIIIILIMYIFIATITITKNNNDSISNNGNISQNVNINIPKNEQTEYIDINNCSKEALISLPDIGEVLALRIIENRPYQDVYQLEKVKGISKGIIQNIKDMVVCK